MSLVERLSAAAGRRPDKPAALSAEGSLTFRELDERSGALARRLALDGLSPGDRVAIWTDHALETPVALWAAWKAGAIAVPVNATLGPAARAGILADCAPAASLLCGRHASLDLGGADLPHPPERVLRLDRGGDWARLPAASTAGTAGAADPDVTSRTAFAAVPRDEDVAVIVYTSGSTGAPKGVTLSHRNLGSVVDAVVEHVPVTADDSYLMLVPLHYVHGLMQLLVHVAAGASVVFAGDFLFPREIVRTLGERRIVEVSGTPWHVDLLVDRGDLLTADLPALRRLGVVGGRLAPERIAQIARARPGLEIHVAYGQTECAPRATALDPARIARKPGSVGSPIPGVTVHVLDERGLPVPRGRTGEVVIEGPNVMLGYWRQPEETARVLDGRGRLRTGDLGWLDAEGDLHLDGRVDDLIKSAGERISPQEIERALRAVPGIRECVVVGVPDRVLGQRIEAHVVLEAAAAAQGDAAPPPEPAALLALIRSRCARELPLQRMPRAVHVWPELPRLANGKTDKVRLAAR